MFADILNSFIDPILVINKEKVIKFVNASFEETFYINSNFIINKNLNFIIDYDSPLILLINKSIKNDINLKEDKLIISLKNQNKKQLKVSIFKTFVKKDLIVIHFEQNLKNQSLLHHKINSKISQSFSSLVEMLMHELKNPLSGIVGATQLLQKDLQSSNYVEMLDLIKFEADRIKILLSNMENLSAGEGHISLELINIHKVLNYCSNSAKNSYGNEILFEEVYDPSLPDFYANEELLIQIFTNLIKNACEAQNNNGRIILKTSYNANKKFLLNENDLPEIKPLQVEVIDFGIGISDVDLQNIFDPFVTKKKDGKGLGLSIVSNSIRTLDGSIEVSSENGRTNFCLNFPLKKP
ncbi:ATP-binding protein [Alphaproteobacteria bacterium]|nr:ATP-binding protein [Alphaproteobacteria bacterium]